MLDPTTTVELPDNRTVSVAEFGDPEGRPIIHLHGAGSCHAEARPFHAAARHRGIRLIAPDRPGVGRSTELPGHTLVSYAHDLSAIADSLGIGRFAVSGVSNGGMYAFAAAHVLGDRVSRVLPINSATPVADPRVKAALSTRTRLSYTVLGLLSPWIARRRPTPPQGLMAKLSPDRASLATPAAREWFTAIETVAMSQAYMGTEIRLATRPWGFDHREITQPVDFLSGVKDAGRGYGEIWVAELPNAVLHLFSGGHAGFLGEGAIATITDCMAKV